VLFSDLDDATSWGLVIEAEPSLGQPLPTEKLDESPRGGAKPLRARSAICRSVLRRR
jgi:hypothetical protein